jgi:FKBP-type peptidyl-prolyl cis-trans isomerase
MWVGGQCQLIIPPELGFGETQREDISKNSILVISDSDLPY